MTSTRLKMAQEGLLWKTALAQLGVEGLYEMVLDVWQRARPLTRTTVEYLDSEHVGSDVLDILRAAQIAVGAVVPNRPGVRAARDLFSPCRVSRCRGTEDHAGREVAA